MQNIKNVKRFDLTKIFIRKITKPKYFFIFIYIKASQNENFKN